MCVPRLPAGTLTSTPVPTPSSPRPCRHLTWSRVGLFAPWKLANPVSGGPRRSAPPLDAVDAQFSVSLRPHSPLTSGACRSAWGAQRCGLRACHHRKRSVPGSWANGWTKQSLKKKKPVSNMRGKIRNISVREKLVVGFLETGHEGEEKPRPRRENVRALAGPRTTLGGVTVRPAEKTRRKK